MVFTQVMFRLSSDERTAELGRRLLADGTCVVTPAVWDGRAVQRCAVSNWSTSEADVAATVAAVRRVVAALCQVDRCSPGTSVSRQLPTVRSRGKCRFWLTDR